MFVHAASRADSQPSLQKQCITNTYANMANKNPNAQALGKLGGLARAKKLTAAQRLRISQAANAAKQQKRPKPVEDAQS